MGLFEMRRGGKENILVYKGNNIHDVFKKRVQGHFFITMVNQDRGLSDFINSFESTALPLISDFS